MAEADAKTKAKIEQQITQLEKDKLAAELKKQEALNIQAVQRKQVQAQQQAQKEQRLAELSQTLAQSKNQTTQAQRQASLAYAAHKSLELTVNISLLIMFVAYWFVFRTHY